MRSVIPNLKASFVLFVIELSSDTFTTSSVILTKREEFIFKFSDRAIITPCKRIIARYYSKSLKQLICVINQAWGQNGWITIPTVAPFPVFFVSSFEALSVPFHGIRCDQSQYYSSTLIQALRLLLGLFSLRLLHHIRTICGFQWQERVQIVYHQRWLQNKYI